MSKMMRLPRVLCCFALWVCLTPWGADASVVLSLSEGALVARTHLIVRGRVESQKTHRVGPRKLIVTDYVLRVSRFFKGRTASALLVVRCMGGSLDGQHARVSGESEMRVGEEVILFLSPARPLPWNRTPTFFYIETMAYGKLTIHKAPGTGVLQVFRQSELPTRTVRDLRGRWSHTQPSYSKAPEQLSRFLSRIQRLIRAQAAATRARQGVRRARSKATLSRKGTRPRRTSKGTKASGHKRLRARAGVQEVQR